MKITIDIEFVDTDSLNDIAQTTKDAVAAIYESVKEYINTPKTDRILELCLTGK